MKSSLSVHPLLFLACLSLMLFSACGVKNTSLIDSLRTKLATSETTAVSAAKPMITIWIHGTKLTPPAIMHDFFYRKLGMHKASTYESRYYMHKIAHALCHEQTDFAHEHFYFFGWSGKLSFNEREKAARELYAALDTLNQEYVAKYGCIPQFRLITHSHGGNVALNLARVKEQNCPFIINELVLLACPVQHATMHLIQDPIFENIFSFYSRADLIQVIDPQGLYKNKNNETPLFSRHLFRHHDKLTQIETKTNKRGFSHIEFLLVRFVQYLPEIIHEVKKEKQASEKHRLTVEFFNQRSPIKSGITHNFRVKNEPLQQSLTHQS